ncbi:MAG TPA: TIGR01777 family oxidoreductase [Bryobacteraceae bacterium]|nr:TIGR01777 family oxidoreductase [Bryobacteraceae bacterium]
MSRVNVAVTGASGFIGGLLTRKLLETGHAVHVLGRRLGAGLPAEVQFSEWRSMDVEPPAGSLASADAVVHLAGEPVAQRWTAEARRRIRDSRVNGTRNLLQALSKLAPRPGVLVSASAIGYYGPHGDEILTENAPPGSDFLANLSVEWEQAALAAEALGIRVVLPRIGVVLGKGGALARMLPPFRFGLGGRLGSGKQWMSWIHVQDLINLIVFALTSDAVRGPVNATAPHPVTNAEFTQALAATLHRPAIFFVPAVALQFALGEMATMVLGGQRVIPGAAETAGFRFQYPDLAPALADLLAGKT